MVMIKKKWLVFSTGLALFSMFFGSGNLVFPIAVGQESDGHYILAALGIILTGVVVPFLGVYGMMLYKGDFNDFFSCFGKRGIFIFSLLSLAILGPFGGIARCLTVCHGAIQLLFWDTTLPMVSFIMCMTIFLCTLNKKKIIEILGNILTPLLLLSISLIAYYGLKRESMLIGIEFKGWTALKNGFLQGYQMMDLLAAFFFSSFIMKYLQNASAEHENGFQMRLFLKASIIGACLLSIVYFSLSLLGWNDSLMLENIPPQDMLAAIAMESLGTMAAPTVCLAVLFACLSTTVVISSLFADFLREEVFSNRINNVTSLIATLAIAFCVSILDFEGIAMFLGPVLAATYPALIMLTVVNIALKIYGLRSTHWPFTLTLAAKVCFI